MLRILLTILSFSLFSCNGSKPQNSTAMQTVVETKKEERVNYINKVKFQSPEKNTVYHYKQKAEIRLSKSNDTAIDSIQLFVDNDRIATIGNAQLNYDFPIPAGKPGEKTVRLIAYHGNNGRSMDSRTIIVLPEQAPVKYKYEVIQTYPHDTKAYTQGLVYLNGYMYEGTGQYGQSGIRKTDMSNGKLLSTLSIDNKLFGEGITIYQDKIFQLTWTSYKGFVYDLNTFTLESTFTYNTQGWGLTTMDDYLIMSDGSNKLYHILPSSFSVIKSVEVYDHKGAVQNLNELEYIDGLVWANVWQTDRIVMIDPANGEVKGELDMSKLLTPSERSKLEKYDEVLNGIAWNPEKQSLFLTGKNWPKLFEIKVIK